MQAVLQQKEISSASEGNSISLGLNMPNDVQNALDSILQYYRRNAMRPIISLQGDPLDITSGLVSQVQATLPANLKDESQKLLNFLMHEIINFCREKQVKSLALNFVFERGGA